MPEQPLTDETRNSAAPGAVGWYGKLPSLGDFASRRLPHALATEWDTWLRAGMDELRTLNAQAWPEAFVAAPVWFFMAPAQVTGNAVIGALAPSMDRVGRYYPLTIMAAAPHAGSTLADDARLMTFFTGARTAIVDARRLSMTAEELDEHVSYITPPFEVRRSETRQPSLIDDILSDLSEASYAQQLSDDKVQLPSGEWRHCLAPQSDHSLWWVSATAREGYRDVKHRGPLNRSLFSQLFSKPAHSEQGPASASFQARNSNDQH